MVFEVQIEEAASRFPEFKFVRALTPSEQKAAFQVRDSNDKDLCLKIIAPNFRRDRMDREIIALQSIKHNNVVKLIEYHFSSREGEQRHYILEEFIDGTDLSENLTDGKPWSLDHVCDFFGELCDGLSALQEKQIVHRDLKPNNIRVRPNNSPVIIDFGLARLLELVDLTGTSQGAKIGTPTFFAPEQFEGSKQDIDCRTDIFAVGILVYLAAVGRHPFFLKGMEFDELREAICRRDDCFSDSGFEKLPPKLKLLIKRMLSKNRIGRPKDAKVIKRILDELKGNQK